jgi:hypothetical protein
MAITTRPVAKHDLKLICDHRERMFAESGRTREALRPMTAAFEQWLSPRLDDGSYFGWMLEDARVVIAGLGMMVIDWAASSGPSGRPPPRVHPQRLCRARAPQQGTGQSADGAGRGEGPELGVCYAILHSTRQGRPLYESRFTRGKPALGQPGCIFRLGRPCSFTRNSAWFAGAKV